jgi:hypothetical protein
MTSKQASKKKNGFRSTNVFTVSSSFSIGTFL